MSAFVLDLTRLLPGPLCGRILACQGHRVRRIVPPAGDLLETLAPETCAWLRQDIECETVDLKSPAGQARVRELAAQAAVLLENFLPGRMAAWDLSPDTLRTRNPSLVYVRLAGHRDSVHAGLPGHDLTYLAAAGLLPQLDGAWQRLPIADLCAAFWMALAVERGLRAGGGFSEVFLGEAAWPASFPPIPGLDGSRCNYAVYPAQSGSVALAALEPHLWSRFCHAAGHPEWEPHVQAPARVGQAVYDAICHWLQMDSAEAWENWAVAMAVPLRAMRSPMR